MEFSAKSIKGLVSEMSTVLCRAKQFARETIGTVDKTELDPQFDSLAERADKTKLWTERIVAKTESLLEPNLNTRYYGDIILDKKERVTNHEGLGTDMIDAGIEFGSGTVYGSALIKVGKIEQNLGQNERQFVANSYRSFVHPLRKFLDEDIRTINKERKVLETKRLDLDSAKSRMRRAKTLDSQNNAEQELKLAQEDFDRQIEITRLLLEGISCGHANHVRCLNDFVTAQIAFYARCHQHMCDLQSEVSNSSSSIQRQTNKLLDDSSLRPTKRHAKALYDYEAKDSKELSVMANEVIVVSHSPDSDTDWMIGEKGTKKGKVPLAYLEILD